MKEPLEIIQKSVEFLRPGTVLDIGAGDGRNATYLAEKGFTVTAIDKNPDLVKLIQPTRNLEVANANLLEYQFQPQYDNIICNFVLHLVLSRHALPLIQKIQNHTVTGGVNVISAFLEEGDFDISDSKAYWFKHEELKELYRGWEILNYEETSMRTMETKADGSNKYQMVGHVIARKIR
jgi:tellurite methyltransferase